MTAVIAVTAVTAVIATEMNLQIDIIYYNIICIICRPIIAFSSRASIRGN